MSGRWKRKIKKAQSNDRAPDGRRYGVMFDDGSVMRAWSGRTQREKAQAYATALAQEYRPDLITLAVWNPSHQVWQRCQVAESTHRHESWWWVRQDKPYGDRVSGRKEVILRAQRIYGGRVEVITSRSHVTTKILDVTP
jgi:hypothetical protein